MRIVIISPHFKPRPGGVADYSFELSQCLHQLGHDVVVVTSTVQDSSDPPLDVNFEIIRVSDWKLANAFRLSRVMGDLKGERYFIQFTPLAFSPQLYGIAPGFLFLYLLMGLRGLKSSLMVHESHYPVMLDARGLLIGLPHFIQFVLTLIISAFSNALTNSSVYSSVNKDQQVCFSHKANEEFWRFCLPYEPIVSRLRTVPVFSNITPAHGQYFSPSPKSESNKDDQEIVLCYFGGQHPTNNIALVRKAFDYCQKHSPRVVSLQVIGIKPQSAPQEFVGPGISLLGHLSEQKVSQKLSEANLLLVPFLDGVSTRRGTLMAGLCHAKAVVTTRGKNTLEDIPWQKIVALTDVGRDDDYCRLVYKLAHNDSAAQELASRGREYYQHHFSSKVCVQNLLSLL